MWSSVSIDGLRPPWRQKIWFSIKAVRGRKSNKVVNERQTLALPYLRRHSS